MQIRDSSVLVTGGASGLGRSTAERLAGLGAKVFIVDLPTSPLEAVAREIGASGFFPGDVTSESQMQQAFAAAEQLGPLRATVHCAGRGGALRVLDKAGLPGSLEQFNAVVQVNLVGSFNVLRLAAASMAKLEEVDGERGVIIMTASIAAYEGQIGQMPYAASKAGVVGMTLVAARDLASRAIRVCTIAPGLFDTPLLARLPEEVKRSLGQSVPHPARLGQSAEYALLAAHIIENPMLNGETIRLDGALRMAPR
jgi:NAD(P)-dependent dehydrogenase (short-subunit alcohol dehydrogenase family)